MSPRLSCSQPEALSCTHTLGGVCCVVYGFPVAEFQSTNARERVIIQSGQSGESLKIIDKEITELGQECTAISILISFLSRSCLLSIGGKRGKRRQLGEGGGFGGTAVVFALGAHLTHVAT